MIKNAVELAKELEIDFKHLQKCWAIFVLDKELPPKLVIETLRNVLSEDEMSFLLYIGLDALSNSINDTLHTLSDMMVKSYTDIHNFN